ncbi:TIGR03085 family metal-binding protein [Actinotalea sp.]|uniref:TIGR03085 family metal-binding protein n=1 Tax=Actinotalea sp. TaxID=1872145 RepID=UPI002BC06C34|nr:TIGR03085 family metal-binding protein [Actinotalea sp.]HRA51392.1 TIGR03085 family metal-binding protein [Actinotalea sp.]
MPWHPLERTALADALSAAGPGAPTRCEGWRSEHLAAHIVRREGSPGSAAGIVVPWLAARTERDVQKLGDRAATPDGYAAIVERVRSGPPPASPMRWAGDAVQLVELFVHTEDVRRGAGRGSALPRTLPPGEQDALWAALRRSARLAYRDSPVGVVLTDGSRTLRARRPPREGDSPGTGRDLPTGRDVVVRGQVGELLLHAFGRSAVAEVTVEGPRDAVAALERVRRS